MPKRESSAQACVSELSSLLRAKDERGIELLVSLYGLEAKAFLKARFGQQLNQLDLDVAFNSALIKVWRYGHSIDEKKNVRAWFFRICRNEVLALCDGTSKPTSPDLSQIPLSNAAIDYETQRFIEQFYSVLDNLPSLQKNILTADLNAGGEERACELAKRYHTTTNSIRVSRSKAKGTMRRQLMINKYFHQSLAS